MGHGGAEADKGIPADIRAELEENRQYLVRALRAVELTTAECREESRQASVRVENLKEESRQATLRAENALSRIHLLEINVAEQDAEIARIERQGEAHIDALQDHIQQQTTQLEEQREQIAGCLVALEAQTLTIRDLREQVYSLQLRIMKKEEEAEQDRMSDDKFAALSARFADVIRNLEGKLHVEIADIIRNLEVKLQAHMSNQEALSALSFEEMESRVDRLTSTVAEQRQVDQVALEDMEARIKTRLAEVTYGEHTGLHNMLQEQSEKINLLENQREMLTKDTGLQNMLQEQSEKIDLLKNQIEMLTKGYSCENDVGFTSGFEQVSAHESNRKFNPSKAKLGQGKQLPFNTWTSLSSQTQDGQADIAALESALVELRGNWEASVKESKSEVEAMFKGEMITTQRLNAMESTLKDVQKREPGTTQRLNAMENTLMDLQRTAKSPRVPEQNIGTLGEVIVALHKQVDQLTQDLNSRFRTVDSMQALSEGIEALREQVEQLADGSQFGGGRVSDEDFEVIRIQVAKSQDKVEQQEQAINTLLQVNNKYDELSNQLSELQQLFSHHVAPPVAMKLKLGLDFNKALGEIGSNKRASFEKDLVQDLTNASGLPSTSFRVKNLSPGSVIADIDMYLSSAGNGVGGFNGPYPSTVANSLQKQAAQPGSKLLTGKVTQALESISFPNLRTDANAAASADSLVELRENWEASVKESKSEVEAMFKGEMITTQRLNAMESTLKDLQKEPGTLETKQMNELKTGLKELKQEHMNLYGRVVSLERLKHASRESADDLEMESRVSRLEVAMIEILEKPVKGTPRSEDSGGEDWSNILERLQHAELASNHVVEGVQHLTQTMHEILEKQKLLEGRLLSRDEASHGVSGGKEGPTEEVELLKNEQIKLQKEMERIGKLTTDAYGDKSPFVPRESLENVRMECMEKVKNLQKELQEKCSSRSFPIESSVSPILGGINDPKKTKSPERMAPGMNIELLKTQLSELDTRLNEKMVNFTKQQEQLQLVAQNLSKQEERLEKATELQEHLAQQQQHLIQQQKALKSDLTTEQMKGQQEISGRMELVEKRVGAMQSTILNQEAPMAFKSPEGGRRDSLSGQILEQYQLAIKFANERIIEHQSVIDELQRSQEMWNGKLDQTLEVANEAFGEKTPFVMKGSVEQLESMQNLLMDEVQALRDTVTEVKTALSAPRAPASSVAPATADLNLPHVAVVALEKEGKMREALQERLTALEPMRDEFIAEKMHTDLEIQSLKKQYNQLKESSAQQQDVLDKLQKEVQSAKSKDSSVNKTAQETAAMKSLADEVRGFKTSLAQQHEALEKLQKETHSAEVKGLKDSLAQQQEALEKLQKEAQSAKSKDSAVDKTAPAAAAMKSLADEMKGLKDSLAQQQEALEKLQKEAQSAKSKDSAVNKTALEAAAMKSLADEVKGFKASLAQQQEALEKLQKETHSAEVKGLKDSIAQQQEALEKLQKEVQSAKSKDSAVDTTAPAAAAMKSLADEVNGLKDSLAQQQEALEKLQKEAQSAKSKDSAVDTTAAAAMKSLADEVKGFKASLAQQQEALEKLQKETHSAEVKGLKDSIAQQQEALEKLQKEVQSAKSKDSAVDKTAPAAAAMKSLADEVKGLKDSLAQQQEALEKLQKEAQSAKSKDSAVDTTAPAAAAMKSLADEVNGLKDSLAQQQEALEKLREDVKQIISPLQGELDALNDCNKSIEKVLEKNEERLISEIKTVKDEMKKLDLQRAEDLKMRRAELSSLTEQVDKLKNSNNIEGDIHKGLSEVEQTVSDCEAGLKSMAKTVESLNSKIQQLEKTNKQADESAISRLASKITELDEAMEVRENENAALDGRVEALDKKEAGLLDCFENLTSRVDDLAHQCKVLHTQTRELDQQMTKKNATKEELLQISSVLERAANKQDLSDLTQVVSRLKQNVTDLEQKNYRADDMALGEFHSAREGSVTARSTNGSFYGDELAVASEGSARIRALAARVRGVTQGTPRQIESSPIPPPAAGNTFLSPSHITSPREDSTRHLSALEETAERIREWEIRNQAKGLSDDDHTLQFV